MEPSGARAVTFINGVSVRELVVSAHRHECRAIGADCLMRPSVLCARLRIWSIDEVRG
jgi:hypothetical protein